MIPFTFENMQLSSIIKIVAERTGRNFLIQTPITGTVLIYAPKMIPANKAFDVLGIILDAQGYTMVVSDDPPLVYVTKTDTAGPQPTELKVKGEGPGLEAKHELVTLIVLLKHVPVDDVQDILNNFKSPRCVVTVYPAANLLILKDEEAKLKYLVSIIERIDVPGTGTIVTFRELKYADAIETAALLTELYAAREGARTTTTALRRPPTPTGRGAPPGAAPTSPEIVGAAAPLKIMADPRTNRLVILASEKDTEDILDLVTKLDVEPTEEMYPIRTYMAQYQDAAELADTLASFVSGQPRSRTGQERRLTTGRTATQARTPTGITQARTTGQTGPATPTGPVMGGTEEAFFLADPATNMVLIQADPRKLDMYMDLLRELDQPQKQVMIEVWIVEISSDNQLDIGVEFQSAEVGPAEKIGPMQNEVFGGSNFDLGLDTVLSGAGFPSSGLNLGIRTLTNTALDIGGKVYYIPNFDTFIRALREDTTVDVLSSPKLLTLNNEPAMVDVSDEISISESRIASYSSVDPTTGIPAGVTETFQRQNVGITLDITPQINSENSVIMDISLQVGNIAGVQETTSASSQPVIANRSTQTRVRVDNGRTIVISGLRRADKAKTTTRLPILGQIPILGLLFSHERTVAVNTNLLIFITPHIVSDTLDMLEITEALKNQDLEEERRRFEPAKKSRKRPLIKGGSEPAWDWKK